MAIFLRLALWASLAFWSASELVIDVQPNVISPEITRQLVINCSITNNQVQHLEVIKSLTLSRYNETIREFEDLFVLNTLTLILKQQTNVTVSQISYGNTHITLTLHNPSQFDAKVYRCHATGDTAEGTNISMFAKKAVEYETNLTALIEEIRRYKKNENFQCTLKKDENSEVNQRSRLHFYGSSEIITELIEPLTITCLYKTINQGEKVMPALQTLYILHETKGVIAYINKGQPVVTAMEEVKSKNVKGELYQNKLKDSYLQLTWTNLKLYDSGKYFCEAHVQYLEGRSEKFTEMLTITVQSPTLNDLVNVIQKLITQVDEDKESIELSKQNIENIREDVNTHHQDIKTIRKEKEINKENITSKKEVLDTITQNIMSLRVDTNNTITMLKKDIDINAGNIKILRVETEENITKLKEELDTNKQLEINFQDSLRMKVANILTDLSELKIRMDEGPAISCRQINSTHNRVIVKLLSGLQVMCDTKTDGGGWIIIQRRINGKVDFYRGWQEYRDGFGDYNIGEFYLGNENIFNLTSTREYDLRIDLELNNTKYFAQYENFKILSGTEKYKLQTGDYSGNAEDSLSLHNNLFFSTFDRDNDLHSGINCAERSSGAWWYSNCYDSNLNGQWGGTSYKRMAWRDLTGSINSVSFSEMKISEREKNYFH
ncbi:BpFREP17.1 [Biomphalaria pfeifferi]|uniref:BpFREP17.1 n=1 Tax=Biomphalaria pfeifferi TaxID=112525 RepID=A0AAD8FE07_BIOPF|nr:BpFREP17.1 [Biomphalaria pfeifferi]